MGNHFERLADQSALDNWIARSYTEPVVVFKHSDACGISSRAYSEIARINCPVGIVTVQTERGISDEIESRFNLMHESPQVLVLHNGEVVWSNSHGGIRAEALIAALERIGNRE